MEFQFFSGHPVECTLPQPKARKIHRTLGQKIKNKKKKKEEKKKKERKYIEQGSGEGVKGKRSVPCQKSHYILRLQALLAVRT